MLLARQNLSVLFDVLHAQDYTIIGPQVMSRAILYDEIRKPDQLPKGWNDEQNAGHYRLTQNNGEALFGFTAGAQSWKRFLFLPQRSLWQAHRDGDGFVIEHAKEQVQRLAFFGMRACELHAIKLLDRVFLYKGVAETDYDARRKAALFIAVNCGKAGDTCFCVSMGTGPRARVGFDLAFTELIDDHRHDFLVEIGSERGEAIATQLPLRSASSEDIAVARAILANTASTMGRQMETNGLKTLLQDNPEHPQWEDVASRCLACANCTFSCPTCFCHSEDDTTDLDGLRANHRQRWDSCFTMDFSHLASGAVRGDVRTRYRQWLTHKLANWIDQFDESGCVGCGRCITWCPAGIDITEEVAKIRASNAEA